MAAEPLRIPRLEGSAALLRDGDGIIRIHGPRTRNVESLLYKRDPREAVYLTQTFSAGAGISHALAAVTATENALGLSVPPNGFMARDLLHALSFLHAHVRHFYFQLLPDYLPFAALASYSGNNLKISRISTVLSGDSAPAWIAGDLKNRFSTDQSNDLVEHFYASQEVLITLQAMMAQLGGKFPIVMSLVPGGMSIRLSEPQILQLERRLSVVTGFLTEEITSDLALLMQKFPEIRTLGQGLGEFLSGGSLGAESGGETALFPSGATIGNRLVPFSGDIVESVVGSRYRIRRTGGNQAPVLVADEDGTPWGSWIKGPRFRGRVKDVGPLARTVIAHKTAATSRQAELVADIESRIGAKIQAANTIGGRLLARVGEISLLIDRCFGNIQRLQPGEVFFEPMLEQPPEIAEAGAAIEAPAGIVWHRLALRRGQIALYEIVAPGTWQGAPSSPGEIAGGIETALNHGEVNLDRASGQLLASRIVHSFAFSMTDAVH